MWMIMESMHSNTPEGRRQATEQAIVEEAERQRNCMPRRMSTTPDGVTLWVIRAQCDKIHGGDDVYFSTRGTSQQYQIHQGKTVLKHTRTIPSN